jgi:hypothetical protein
MQVEFRVEVRRCHLSHELEAQGHYRSRRKLGLANQHLQSKICLTLWGTSHHLRKRFVKLAADPEAVQQDGELSGHANNGPHGGFVTSTLALGQTPSPERRILTPMAQDVMRALD